MNRRIEVANDVPRNGISKTYFSYYCNCLFTTLSLVMFLTPINRLHKNGFTASMVAPQLKDNLMYVDNNDNINDTNIIINDKKWNKLH